MRSHAQERSGPGDGPDAVAALHRTPIALAGRPRVAGALGLAYGFTESVANENGLHHRLAGALAGSVRPIRGLDVWLGGGLRYDTHPSDALGSDYGYVATVELGVRGAFDLDGVGLGGDLELEVPGRDFPSLAFDALALSARAFASFELGDFWISLAAGFRFDRTGEIFERGARLRMGDRIAAGISDSHAILGAIGLAYSPSSFTWFGELTADALVGPDAPSLDRSPIRFATGVRYSFLEWLSSELVIEAALNGRPPVELDAARVPIEPRLRAEIGLRIELPFGAEQVAIEHGGEQRPVPEPGGDDPPAGSASLAVRVVDADGAPVADVIVELARESGEPMQARTDASGTARFERVPTGRGRARVLMEGYGSGVDVELPSETAVEIAPDAPLEVEARVEGIVRAIDGRPLAATGRVTPGGAAIEAGADGSYSIALEPGDYTIEFRARGHRSRRVPVTILERQITILHVELEPAR
jgi:hypothetical protein